MDYTTIPLDTTLDSIQQFTIPGLEIPDIDWLANPPEGIPSIETECETHTRAGQAVYDLINDLIETHPEISHLRVHDISLLLKNPPKRGRKSGKKFAAGEARKFSKKDSLYHGYSFEISLDSLYWAANPDKRMPLLFHELLHCGENEDGEPVMSEHNLQEFAAVVETYGAWEKDVAKFLDAANSNNN